MGGADAADILEWLRRHAAAVVPGARGDVPFRLLRHMSHTSDLYVIRVGEGSTAVRLVAKRCYVRSGPIEMRNFARFNSIASTEPVRCPEALAYVPSLRMLLMRYEPGLRMETLIKRGGAHGLLGAARLTEAVRWSGVWLALWHTVADEPDWRTVPERHIEKIVAGLRGLDDHGEWFIRGETRSRVEDVIRRTLAAGPPRTLSALTHGDYGPSNVLAAPTGVRVLDMIHETFAPVYDDIAGMLVSLETMCSMRAVSAERTEALAATFLQSYLERGGVALDPSMLAFYRIKALLRYAVTHASKVERLPAGLADLGKAALVRIYDRLFRVAVDGAESTRA